MQKLARLDCQRKFLLKVSSSSSLGFIFLSRYRDRPDKIDRARQIRLRQLWRSGRRSLLLEKSFWSGRYGAPDARGNDLCAACIVRASIMTSFLPPMYPIAWKGNWLPTDIDYLHFLDGIDFIRRLINRHFLMTLTRQVWTFSRKKKSNIRRWFYRADIFRTDIREHES